MVPVLTNFCGMVSVQTGTFIICIFSVVTAVLGFVPWVSTGVNLLREVRRMRDLDDPVPKHFISMYVLIGAGALSSLMRILMAASLERGLQKEECRFLRWYLVLAMLVMVLNLMVLGVCIATTDILLGVSTVAVMCLEGYFILVIRSAYKKMQLEEEEIKARYQQRREEA